tara:strand:+ start:627 stop:758 length:132 start_codon:yes stop_codon:yes gene_type:complete
MEYLQPNFGLDHIAGSSLLQHQAQGNASADRVEQVLVASYRPT